MSELKVGDTVWVFDPNFRVYRKDANGHSTSGPIWRESWRPYLIESETSRRWVLKYGRIKVPKKRADFTNLAYSQSEIDELGWMHDRRAKIVRMVQQCSNTAVLRHIAALVGYKEME